ncbi:FAD-binding oxidoreductase [Starkeya sp. ORNL1]|uniref:FAD-binding oxidoreductase n=1 Tax=Starkeya sp. ORNL1 TaxID=2709380 RepID=UPI0014640BCB|nr:FAD-binding oxidoreductase [Starkeya sp. ORNL1]QJP13665.1 FAD-binding oxidoreductase [Starkeya sp. ORNL1]
MQQGFLKNRTGAAVEQAAIDGLRERFAGILIHPHDPGYDSARRIWNASIDKNPGLIAMCSGTADVIHAVDFARSNDVLVAVRSGGHNVAGRALCDDGIVIDLSAMKGIIVDPQAGTVCVQAGVTLGQLDRETAVHGLAVPTGVAPPTGIAGLTLGGGVGWLTRKYGMTCDSLLSCEVVTATGGVVTASAASNPDLFWGLRGGGGNFGIVTSLLFRAHPVATVLGGLLLYPRDQAAAVLRHYRDAMASAPNELTAYAGLICTPDGTPVTGIMVCYCGELEEGERVLHPLRSFGPPMLDMVQPLPFVEMQKLAYQQGELETRNYWRSTFLKELSDAAIDLIVEHANMAASPLTGTIVQVLGGAASLPAGDDTAYAPRRELYNIGIEARWIDATENAGHVDWARNFARALERYSSRAYMLNFLSDEGPEAIRDAFGANHARLVALKRKYDPENFFRLNQNIDPQGLA